ncbi:MAG: T9SS type A sorting domain-containing protein [Bacteroidales bacterium]|nr:T9SS type A sorting domain-containing protein [Bacteroidales bacterium]MCF8403715.1 T9SS type A sorting domain-containing protein [Bacteroidales bacterium]
MKKSLTLAFVATLIVLFINTAVKAQNDSIQMGAGYANDIYYSLENGEVQMVERTNWDLGFFTNPFSAGIITNDGNGVTLYTYPNADTNGWATIDTSGLMGWTPLYNSPENWELGAFNVNELGHPDYGWCVYNSITHDLVGDSLYIISFADGSAKKLWIKRKHSIASTFYFTYADLDGSNQVNEVLDCSGYADKNFVYYSMMNQEVLDREPASDTWDLLFTKYMGILEGGVPYPVTGVLNNTNVPANRFDEVSPDYINWSAIPFDSTKAPIGHDWKYFDMNIFSYVVDDSIAFFVSNKAQDVYKLAFSIFDYTVGNVVFNKSLISLANTPEFNLSKAFKLFPNPASENIMVSSIDGEVADYIRVLDLTGKVVLNIEASHTDQSVFVGNLRSGVYFVQLQVGNKLLNQKMIIR